MYSIQGRAQKDLSGTVVDGRRFRINSEISISAVGRKRPGVTQCIVVQNDSCSRLCLRLQRRRWDLGDCFFRCFVFSREKSESQSQSDGSSRGRMRGEGGQTRRLMLSNPAMRMGRLSII